MTDGGTVNDCDFGQQELLTLMGVTSGCHQITTASDARYEIDLDSATLTRMPEPPVREPNRLLRDGVAVELLGFYSCAVGHPAEFAVNFHVNGIIPLVYTTTMVQRIEPARQPAFPPVDAADGERS